MRKIDCAHRKNLKKFFGGQKIEKNASKLGVVSFNPNKIIFGGFWPPKNFFRIFRCAQSIPRTKLPLKMILLGLKLITPNFDAIFFIFWPPENFFRIFRCAQSIFRIKLPLKGHLLKKFKKIFYSTILYTPPPLTVRKWPKNRFS